MAKIYDPNGFPPLPPNTVVPPRQPGRPRPFLQVVGAQPTTLAPPSANTPTVSSSPPTMAPPTPPTPAPIPMQQCPDGTVIPASYTCLASPTPGPTGLWDPTPQPDPGMPSAGAAAGGIATTDPGAGAPGSGPADPTTLVTVPLATLAPPRFTSWQLGILAIVAVSATWGLVHQLRRTPKKALAGFAWGQAKRALRAPRRRRR